MSRHPVTKWAQRSDKVYLTIELPDAKDVKLDLQPEGHFSFSAASGADNAKYQIDFELFDKVNVDESKAAVGPRAICYIIKKAEVKWWSRLLKQDGKPPVFLKVDWDKWVDEDDEKENKFDNMDFGGMDFSKLGMGGADDEFEDELEDTAALDEDDKDMEEATPDEDAKVEGTVPAAPAEAETKA